MKSVLGTTKSEVVHPFPKIMKSTESGTIALFEHAKRATYLSACTTGLVGKSFIPTNPKYWRDYDGPVTLSNE